MVLFNVGCRLDDFSYWLAHELGHCLTLHALTGDAGERFAELFAQTFKYSPKNWQKLPSTTFVTPPPLWKRSIGTRALTAFLW